MLFIKLIALTVALGVFAVPIVFLRIGRSLLPLWLKSTVTFLIKSWIVVLSFGAVLGIALIFGWLPPDGDCLQSYYDDKKIVTSPDGKRQAIVSSGVCVTGLLAPDSYSSVNVEIAKPGGGQRKLIFQTYNLAFRDLGLEWENDALLEVRLGAAMPVSISSDKVDGVAIEYHVSSSSLEPPNHPPNWFGNFRKWADKRAVID